MEDKIRNLLWSFLSSPLSILLIFGGWFSCIMALVYNSALLAFIGLGIIIFVYFLIILLDVLDSRDFQRKSVKRIEELNKFREKIRGSNHE
jgi:hypothetical protein